MSAEVKHTPTDWVKDRLFVYALDLSSSVNRFSVSVQGGFTTKDGTRTSYGELEANARLIAAAPELLEALRDLLELTDDPSNDADPSESIFAFARAAIAKATGAA